ncbi:MAG: hypothetical protein QNJ45_27850 [Ardenticatenaceae bacterium]|nr:hypothetical protein [Ardenticatenaceae bacterium]
MDNLTAGMGAVAIISTLFTMMIAGLLITYFLIRYVRQAFFPNSDLVAGGLPAQATVLKAWQTGVIVNHNPQIGLHLKVFPTQGNPYEVETKAVVNQLHLAQLQVGNQIAVKIDPQDQSRVILAWN